MRETEEFSSFRCIDGLSVREYGTEHIDADTRAISAKRWNLILFYIQCVFVLTLTATQEVELLSTAIYLGRIMK